MAEIVGTSSGKETVKYSRPIGKLGKSELSNRHTVKVSTKVGKVLSR